MRAATVRSFAMSLPEAEERETWDTATFRMVGSGPLCPPTGAGGTTRSGMVTARTAAAAMPATPTQ